MFGSNPPLGAVPAPAEPIANDVACRRCGYNLRGLSQNGRCPECGTPVGLSLHGDLLRFSDPRWLETLRTGINAILIGIGLMILAVIVSIVAGAVSRGRPGLLSNLVSWASGIVTLIGIWLLTSPDPSGIGEDRYGTARKLVRIAVVAEAIGTVLSSMTSLSGPPSPSAAIAVAVLAFIGGLLSLIGLFAQLYYLEKLAMRIPDMNVAGRAHFLMWAIAISNGVIIVMALLMAVMVVGTSRGGASTGAGAAFGGLMAFTCVIGIAGIALLIFYVMYVFMLARIGKQIQAQAQIARAIWAQTIAPAAPRPDSR